MNMIAEINTGGLSHGSMAVVAIVGILALLVAMKIGHAITRLIFGLIGLAAFGAAVWWFFLKH
jgi:hypothetical protein